MPSVSVQLNGATIDPALVVADVTIRSGRSRADDGLSASSCTVDLLTPDPAGVSVSIADQLRVVVDGQPRFQGTIGEITRASLDGGDASTYTLVAVGAIAHLPRTLITMPLPAQSARTRMQNVFATAGLPVVIEGGDSYQLAALGQAGDGPSGADAVIAAIMTDTGCIVADLGDGSVLVQFLDSRLSADVFAPDPALTHVNLEWEQTDDLVNDVTVEWPGGAPATATSPDSVTRYGKRSTSLQSGLGSLTAAQYRASTIVSRLAFPAWQVGTVETWDPAVMAHRIGAIVTLSPLPASSPVAGGAWSGVLEGWNESYGPDADGNLAGTWTLAVSDRAHSAETVAWQNVSPPTLQWAQVNPATSWAEAISNADLYP